MSIGMRHARPAPYLPSSGALRPVAVALLLVTAVALQSTVLTRLTILGVVPQILFVAVVSLALIEGETVGVVAGFCAGLLLDLLLPQSVLGVTAFVYTGLAYVVGLARFSRDASPWVPVAVVAAASVAAEAGYAVLAVALGQPWVSFGHSAKIGGLVALYNTLLTPFVFPAVKRVAEHVRPERVVRF